MSLERLRRTDPSIEKELKDYLFTDQPIAHGSERIDSTVLVARRFGIDTRQEPVIFLRSDSPVARSEGFEAMSRVNVKANGRSIIATLVIVGEELLPPEHAGLSDGPNNRGSA